MRTLRVPADREAGAVGTGREMDGVPQALAAIPPDS